jgi:hypothetical protein
MGFTISGKQWRNKVKPGSQKLPGFFISHNSKYWDIQCNVLHPCPFKYIHAAS